MSQDGGSDSLITEDAGCMSETLTQWLGFGGNIGTWLGTLVIAPIAERFFERCVPSKSEGCTNVISSGQLGRLRKRVCVRRFKLCLLLLFAAQLVLFGLYTVSQPIGSYPALLPSTGTSLFVRHPRVSCMSAGYVENTVIDLTSKLLHRRRCFSALHPHSSVLPRRSFLS
eukprot:COSAG02_NODE_7092_length_3189_cov_2.683172_1_plen_170_part_00